MKHRHYTPLDHLVMNVDQALRTLAGKPMVTERPNPADDREESELSEAEKAQVMGGTARRLWWPNE